MHYSEYLEQLRNDIEPEQSLALIRSALQKFDEPTMYGYIGELLRSKFWHLISGNDLDDMSRWLIALNEIEFLFKLTYNGPIENLRKEMAILKVLKELAEISARQSNRQENYWGTPNTF